MEKGDDTFMRPSEIKAELIRKEITQVSIAENLNVSQPAVAYVISGRLSSRRIRQAIADIIGKPVDEIWPNKTA